MISGLDDLERWAAALASCPVSVWRGPAWRFHKRRYGADDSSGSLLYPGRYHRGWPTLYLGLRSHIAQGELTRHLTPTSLPLLHDEYRLTEFWVELEAVLVCCVLPTCVDSAVAGTTSEELCGANDFAGETPTTSQQLGGAAAARGVEGMIVPSCTGYAGGNLVLFPSRLRAGSVVSIVRSEDPTLYVER